MLIVNEDDCKITNWYYFKCSAISVLFIQRNNVKNTQKQNIEWLHVVIPSLNPLDSVLESTPNRALERIQLCSYWSMKIVSPLSVLVRSTLNNLMHDESSSFARATRIHFLWPHWNGKHENSLTIITTVIINLLTWNSNRFQTFYLT